MFGARCVFRLDRKGRRMIRRLLLGPYVRAAPLLEHRNWIIRGTAQAIVLGVASVWLVLGRGDAAEGDRPDPSDGVVQQLSASTELRDFLLDCSACTPAGLRQRRPDRARQAGAISRK